MIVYEDIITGASSFPVSAPSTAQMEKINSNSNQEAPQIQQVSSCGDAENPDTETQGINLSKPPAAEPSASNGRQHRPCRRFRQGYCRKGSACRFQHVGSETLDSSAANGTSSDDRVCRFYQQGRCRFGDSCRFRHIQPPAIKEDDGGEGELDPLQLAKLIRRMEGFQGLTEKSPQEDLGQRFRNRGFTDEEVLELACHGVKPWDYEAAGVLDVLNITFGAYIRRYVKNVTQNLPEDRREEFINNVEGAVKRLLSMLNDFQFFVGQSMREDGALVFAYYKEGMDPVP